MSVPDGHGIGPDGKQVIRGSENMNNFLARVFKGTQWIAHKNYIQPASVNFHQWRTENVPPPPVVPGEFILYISN